MTTRILGGKGNRTRRSQKASCRATTSRRPPTRYERSHTRKVNLCIIQVPPNRFKEMGDIYLAMSLYLRSFDPESRKAAKGFALWNFVFFLTLPDAREGSPPHSQARRRIQEIAVVFREGHSVRVAIEQGTDQALIGALHLLPNSFGCPDAGSQVAEIPIEGASLAGVAALTMPSP